MSYLETGGMRKRKRGERVFKLKTFGEKGCPVEEVGGSFRENVKALLEFGNLESGLCGGIGCWSFQLEVHRHPPAHVLLLVIEEPVEVSLNRHCNHCLYIGWGEHMICNKKYHFLVPSKDTVAACWSYERNCNGADHSGTGKFNLVELQGHIMHGVFHSNGFGHLLCINGMEMGSDLAGYQIMEFWDRLCTGLQARKVSLKDNSHKRSMDLRLLYGIAYNEPWFGRWGYKFGRGSFGVTQQMYQKSIKAIQNTSLSSLAHHLPTSTHEFPTIFSKYQTLSGHSLVSLGDLFRFMLELKFRLPKESNFDSYNPGILVETTCRWSPRRVEMATRVIVEALKRAEFRWVSRQEVRDAARSYIGDTGLLDFVLKSLGNHVVGNYLVRRCLNPVTKVLEYCLEDISGVFPNPEGFITNCQDRCRITRVQLLNDMFFLYKHIVIDQNPKMNTGIFATISLASRIILDSKHLVKDYCGNLPSKFEVCPGEKSNLYCTIIVPHNGQVDGGTKKVVAPYECVTLRNNATINELVLEVERTFKEIYWGLKSFIVESIVNLHAKKSDLVFRAVRSGSKLVLQGTIRERGIIIQENICEGGRSNFVVECSCGAKDDDGERMVSCDICEVWQHTRCVRIPNNEETPNIFLCSRCEQGILVLPSLP